MSESEILTVGSRATGWSIVANIGGDRQITVQSHFYEEEAASDRNAMIDAAVKLVERQQAIGERPGLVKRIQNYRDQLTQTLGDREVMILEHPAQVEKAETNLADLRDEALAEKRREAEMERLQAPIQEMITRRDDTYNEGFMSHTRSGRGGQYKPSGHRAATLERMESDIKKAKALFSEALVEYEAQRIRDIEAAEQELKRLENELEVALSGLKVSETKLTQTIESDEARLREIDALLEE